jgi:hypothetical protein
MRSLTFIKFIIRARFLGQNDPYSDEFGSDKTTRWGLRVKMFVVLIIVFLAIQEPDGEARP